MFWSKPAVETSRPSVLWRALANRDLLPHDHIFLLKQELGESCPLGRKHFFRCLLGLRGYQSYVEVEHLVDVVVKPVRLHNDRGIEGGRLFTCLSHESGGGARQSSYFCIILLYQVAQFLGMEALGWLV